MSSNIKNENDLLLNINEIESLTLPMKLPKTSAIDPQVKVKNRNAPRRSFDTAYKLRILSAFENCENASERGALLRKEGLYHSRICAWKQQFENDKLNIKKKKQSTTRLDHLSRENEQLKKKLAHAEAVIDLQKKISDLLGTHILPAEISEVKS